MKKLKVSSCLNNATIDQFFRLAPKKRHPKPFLNRCSLGLLLDKVRTPEHQRYETLLKNGLIPKPHSQTTVERKVQRMEKKLKEKEEKTVRKKVQRKDDATKIKDRIKKYMEQFNWLIVKNESELFCSYCIKYCDSKQIKAFSHQKDLQFIYEGSNSIKKDNLEKHARRILHQKAIWCYGSEREREDLEKLQKLEGRNIQDMIKEDKDKYCEEELFPLFSTSYFVAKNDLALLDGERLIKFLSLFKVSIPSNYRNIHSIKEAIEAISISLRNKLLLELTNCSAINLQIDELSDISKKKVLTMNIRYFNNGIISSKFLGLIELSQFDSQTIYEQLTGSLKSLGIYEKIKSICSDGAPVIISKKDGLLGKLMRNIKGLLSIHCLSHRLNLCVTDLWKGDLPLRNINILIFNLCKYFSNSCVKIKILLDHEKALLNQQLNLIKPLDVRWLSKFSAVKRILLLYPAIIQTLYDLSKKGDPCSTGLLLSMKNVRTIGHLLILCDIGFIIEPLNQLLQKRDLEFEQVNASLVLTKIKMQALCEENNYGECLKGFFKEMTDSGTFRKTKLNIKEEDISYIKKRSNDLAKLACKSLIERLGQATDFVPLQTFALKKIRKFEANSEPLASFGNQNINILSRRFGLDEKKVLESWKQLKSLAVAYPDKNELEFYDLVLNLEEILPLKSLVEIYLSRTFSSNECERTFSRYNLIKTEVRSSLSTETMEQLLLIGLNGPQIDKFTFYEAIETWKSMKNRYFVKKI